jgi:hypothetical protein
MNDEEWLAFVAVARQVMFSLQLTINVAIVWPQITLSLL